LCATRPRLGPGRRTAVDITAARGSSCDPDEEVSGSDGDPLPASEMTQPELGVLPDRAGRVVGKVVVEHIEDPDLPFGRRGARGLGGRNQQPLVVLGGDLDVGLDAHDVARQVRAQSQHSATSSSNQTSLPAATTRARPDMSHLLYAPSSHRVRRALLVRDGSIEPSGRESSDELGGSAERHAFGRGRRRRVREAHHLERVEQAEQRSQKRDQQRHLKGPVPRMGIDPDDLVLGRPRILLQLLLKRGVAHDLGVVLERL